MIPMRRIKLVPGIVLIVGLTASEVAISREAQRINRKPPDVFEAQRIASDIAMNDSLLRKGDIVVTNRGFFVFRGVAPDGYTFEFSPVPNPVTPSR
jgi:hypothetical protein